MHPYPLTLANVRVCPLFLVTLYISSSGDIHELYALLPFRLEKERRTICAGDDFQFTTLETSVSRAEGIFKLRKIA